MRFYSVEVRLSHLKSVTLSSAIGKISSKYPTSENSHMLGGGLGLQGLLWKLKGESSLQKDSRWILYPNLGISKLQPSSCYGTTRPMSHGEIVTFTGMMGNVLPEELEGHSLEIPVLIDWG